MEITEHKVEMEDGVQEHTCDVQYDFEGNRYESRHVDLSWDAFEGGGESCGKNVNGKFPKFMKNNEAKFFYF